MKSKIKVTVRKLSDEHALNFSRSSCASNCGDACSCKTYNSLKHAQNERAK